MTDIRGKAVTLVLTSAMVSAVGCESTTLPTNESIQAARVFTGYVIDEDGKPLEGAEVKSSDGTFTATTNLSGQFIILVEDDTGMTEMMLTASKDGYMQNSTYIPMPDNTSHYSILLTLGVGEVMTLNATTGGQLAFANNKLLLSFGENGWADVDGNPIDGDIDVYANYIEPESLRPDRMPVPSMQAWDPASPDLPVTLASFGMFNMEAYQGSERVYPASGTEFGIEFTQMDRFVDPDCTLNESNSTYECDGIRPGSAIPFWTMGDSEDKWNFDSWFTVVDYGPQDGAQKMGASDDDLIDSDNTRYSVVVDVPVGTYGDPPPQTMRYNCDARPILSCVTGKVMAGGLHGSTESTTDPRDSLTYEPVSGAWVGMQGTGVAQNCAACSCTRNRMVTVCDDPSDANNDGDKECYDTVEEYTVTVGPVGSGTGTDPCPPSPGDKACTCSRWDMAANVMYAGSGYTNSSGTYCANAGQNINEATVLKEWLITETDPETGAKNSYSVAYEHHENPRLSGLSKGHMCEDGNMSVCGTWNHNIPCEWFWANNACAVVGGCEVFHMREYDDDPNYEGWYK